VSRRLHGSGLDIFEGTGSFGRRRRGPGAFTTAMVVVVVGALIGAAGWVLYRHLHPNNHVPLLVLGVSDLPIAGATVTGPDGATSVTDDQGRASLAFAAPADLQVAAPGYQTGVFQVNALPTDGALGLQLDPVVLKGRVTDPEGNGVSGATVQVGEQEVTTDEVGAFEVEVAVPGPVQASKMAWETAEQDWDGSPGRFEMTMSPFIVKGVRVYASVAGSPTAYNNLLDMIDGTAVNTLVFDTKEESGAVLYGSQVPDAQAAGAVINTYDVHQVLAAAKERGLHTITRIVTFQDNYWAPAHPEQAAHNTATGGVWTNYNGVAWLDPTDRASWEYPIALGVEACHLGFDEVQFDYVRFPSDGDISVLGYDEPVDADTRVQTVAAFLAEARDRLHAEGCVVSADVFAIVLSVSDDEGIGQRVQEVSASVDAISPMIYPSHYSNGWLGFDSPNDHPSEVVSQALSAGMPKLQGGLLRPWLQAFYYDGDQIAEEIAQAESRGLGWMLWNATSDFQADWFPTG
jgi:hypothetical protein